MRTRSNVVRKAAEMNRETRARNRREDREHQRQQEQNPTMSIERTIKATALVLSMRPTSSYRHFSREELQAGVEQMLADLRLLAEKDGCIAAAWAFEVITETA